MRQVVGCPQRLVDGAMQDQMEADDKMWMLLDSCDELLTWCFERGYQERRMDDRVMQSYEAVWDAFWWKQMRMRCGA